MTNHLASSALSLDEQHARADGLRSRHRAGDPLVLVNIWDVGSAHVVVEAGARALATSSWAVAAACGWSDGEQLPLDQLLQLVHRLSSRFLLPLTVDLETGYGEVPDAVGATVQRVLAAGAVGCNLEDRDPQSDSGRPRPVDVAAGRLAAARAACDEYGVPAFVNARTDVFLSDPQAGRAGLEDVLARAGAYANAGADGLFVPGLQDLDLINELVASSPLPVNVMVDSTRDLGALTKAGVSRISYGASAYVAAATALHKAAQVAFERQRVRQGDVGSRSG